MIHRVYVPVAGFPATMIDRGSGVVGRGARRDGLRVQLDYEGNRYGAVNIRTFADRVKHAAGRQKTDYPTIARCVTSRVNVREVGVFDDDTGVVTVYDSGVRALCDWLGVDPDDGLGPDELVTTSLTEWRV